MVDEAAAETASGDAEPLERLEPGVTGGYLGPRVRVLWNVLSARMSLALEPFGLKTGAFSTMVLISANPGCSQNQLARALGMDKSAVVAIIDELEARGLASRSREPHDRRRHCLSLTPEGELLLRDMYGPVSRVALPVREALSKHEMEQLLSLLARAYLALEGADAPGAMDAKGKL